MARSNREVYSNTAREITRIIAGISLLVWIFGGPSVFGWIAIGIWTVYLCLEAYTHQLSQQREEIEKEQGQTIQQARSEEC